MSKLAAELGAINLSQGFPDFDCDPALVDAVARHMREGRNQYAPMQGVPALREAIAAKYRELYGAALRPGHARSRSRPAAPRRSSTRSRRSSIPGDEVIVFEPCYDSYVPAIELNGGTRGRRLAALSRITRCPGTRCAPAITPRTRLIMLNSPHNPTGAVLDADDIGGADARCVAGTDILIVSDEVYEHIIFDGVRHESMARYADARARAASSSDRSARPTTSPAGRSATPWRRRR